ncbi:hypothetical protein BJ742DRAFT_743844 [Cladochytrium replicatum]|nr:hypothetical protein BJ742DRAFT_743844 [Cladochytrium replicatum]
MAVNHNEHLASFLECLHRSLVSGLIPSFVAQWSPNGNSILVYAEKEFSELAVSLWYPTIERQVEDFGVPNCREMLRNAGFSRKRYPAQGYTEIFHPSFQRSDLAKTLTISTMTVENQNICQWDIADGILSTKILNAIPHIYPPQAWAFSEPSTSPSAASSTIKVKVGLAFPDDPVDIYFIVDASWIALNFVSIDVVDGQQKDISVYDAAIEAIVRYITHTRRRHDRVTVLIQSPSMPPIQVNSLNNTTARSALCEELRAKQLSSRQKVETNAESRRFNAAQALRRLKSVLRNAPRDQDGTPLGPPTAILLVSDKTPILGANKATRCPVHVISLPGLPSCDHPATDEPLSWICADTESTMSNFETTQNPRQLVSQLATRFAQIISSQRQSRCLDPHIGFKGINGARIVSIAPLHKTPLVYNPHQIVSSRTVSDYLDSKMVPDVAIKINDPQHCRIERTNNADETWMASHARFQLEVEAAPCKMFFDAVLIIPPHDIDNGGGDSAKVFKRRAVESIEGDPIAVSVPLDRGIDMPQEAFSHGLIGDQSGVVLPYLLVSLECMTRESEAVKRTKHWLCGRVFRPTILSDVTELSKVERGDT